MEAKEYVKKFLEDEEKDKFIAVQNLALGLFSEIDEMAKKRKVASNTGLAGILKELNERYYSIRMRLKKTKQMDVLKENGFKDFSIKRIPMLAKLNW